ncbi:hypothetical protein [Ruminococcus bicirculans (ex Wegman et al. 2014)]|uniref:hypothetical protein n=1 Tax=Ruminococcus bicirculans (ex Wegman et al. 2014) TaxID=1160721 RepID=UPI00307E5058
MFLKICSDKSLVALPRIDIASTLLNSCIPRKSSGSIYISASYPHLVRTVYAILVSSRLSNFDCTLNSSSSSRNVPSVSLIRS